MAQRIQFRKGTAAAATAANPILADGEPGYETNTGKVKIGDGVTAWNSLPYREQFVGCKVKRVAAYTMATAAVTAIPWDSEEYDTHGFHDNATNNTRLTVPTGQAGVYSISGVWVPDNPLTAGSRALIRLYKNGVEQFGSEMEGGGVNASPVMTGFIQLAAADYVEMSYYISAAAMPMYQAATAFAIQKVGVL